MSCFVVLLLMICSLGASQTVLYYPTTESAECGTSTLLSINKTTSNIASNASKVIIGFPGTAFNAPNQFQSEATKFAELGYTFYQVNTRVWQTHHTFAGCALQDGRDAFKYIVEQQVVDAKVFVLGASAGGAIALNLLPQWSHKIHSLVLLYPLVNTVHFYRIGKQPWLKNAQYAKRISPHRHIPKLVVPILCLVGKKDKLTPFRPQLVDYMRAVSKKNKVKLFTEKQVDTGKFSIVSYSNAAHAFQDKTVDLIRRDWLRQDLMQRADRFYKRYE